MKGKPNILYILSDDHGAWAMRCAGNDEILTPNLDRIAKSGMRFENFFCASPVCSPARASLLTGKIPSAHGVHDWIRSGNVDAHKFEKQGNQTTYGNAYKDEDKPIQYLSGQTCYTDILEQNGYTCALSGKWHLGDSITPQHGFSYWYTIGKGGCNYYQPDMIENGDITVENGKYVTDLITDKALDFLDILNKKENPFYLSVHYTAPHSPWDAANHPDEYIAMYDNRDFKSTPDVPNHKDFIGGPVYGTPNRNMQLRGYYAAITAMDTCIGKLLDRLDELGLTKDTIVIFNGDNGMSMGHHGIWGKGNGTVPFNMFDTAIKVPFILSYSPLVEKDAVCTDMVSGYDFLPTLIDLLKLPEETKAITKGLPGKSFYPSLKGEALSDVEVIIFDEYGSTRMIRTKSHKYIHRYPNGKNEFYDLINDPNEEQNLIDDSAYAELILKLRGKLENWFISYTDSAVDGTKENVTGSGQLCSAGIYAQKLIKYAQA